MDRKVCTLEKMTNFDPSLLTRATLGDQDAYTVIIRYFFPIVKSISASYFLVGGDRDDLIQEGLIGLYRAVVSFDSHRHNNFVLYARICIHRAMLNAVKADNRLKNTFLNHSGRFGDDESEPIGGDPLDEIVRRESILNAYEKMEQKLSPLEQRVLMLSLEGHSHTEIAEALNKNTKSVENAFSRIRKKLS